MRTCCSTIWNVLLFSPGSSSVIGALGVSVQVLGCGRYHPEDHLLLLAHAGPASPVHQVSPSTAHLCSPGFHGFNAVFLLPSRAERVPASNLSWEPRASSEVAVLSHSCW